MIDLKLNSSADLRKEGKSFYWASFFLPKSYKEKSSDKILFLNISFNRDLNLSVIQMV